MAGSRVGARKGAHTSSCLLLNAPRRHVVCCERGRTAPRLCLRQRHMTATPPTNAQHPRQRKANLAYPPVIGFRSRKAAQVCAFLASVNGGIEKLALVKLVYLTERDAMARLGRPMLFDELYSLPHGPVCSATLNGINGGGDGIWAAYLTRNGNHVYPARAITRAELDEVSDAEFESVLSVRDEFSKMSASQLRNYTHKYCAEYTEVPEGSRMPISYKSVFDALGFTDAGGAAAAVDEYRQLEALLEHE